MAKWIDLSAHNLALWRVGEDRNGKKRYVLMPIFQDVKHTVPDPDGPIGKAFQWNMAVGGYVLNLRMGESTPAKAAWFEQFPGATLQERDLSTFPIHQPSMSDLRTLPLRSPWVWSNQENPERFYANEEQALADGSGPAVLRTVEDIDPSGIEPIPFPVEVDALEEMMEDDVNAEFQEDSAADAPDHSESPASDAPTLGEPGLPADDLRKDYGEYIPGARKSEWETVRESLEAQKKILETTGKLDAKSIDALSGKIRRDIIWGKLEDRLSASDVAASPLKQELWKWLYHETPASVKSTYWDGRRKSGVSSNSLYLRAIAYPEILKSIERRMDAMDLSEGADIGRQLRVLFASDPDVGKADGVNSYTSLYPSGPFVNLPDALTSASKVFPVSMEAYTEILDHPSYNLFQLLSGIKKESESALRKDAIYRIVGPSFSDSDESIDNDLEQQVQSSFEPFIAVEVERLLEREIDRIKTMSNSGLRVNHGRAGDMIGEKLFAAKTREERDEIIAEYKESQREEVTRNVRSEMSSPYLAMVKIVDTLNNASMLRALFEDNEHYRNEKRMTISLAEMSMDRIANHLIFAENLRENRADSTEQAVETETDGETTVPDESDVPEFSYREPEFIKWNPAIKPLPPEQSDEEGYRKGPDTIRRGDVTEEMLCDRFGFRGVQYGNWMTQKDRREHLNAAFDGFCDIQKLMDVDDPKAISLPRLKAGSDEREPLALALGARGRGRFAAHYEPGLHVINMTKIHGAGSLFHEWIHANDYFIGAQITRGGNTAASDIEGNPISDHVDTLRKRVQSEDGMKSLYRAVAEQGRDKIMDMIGKAFISKDIQSRVLHDLMYHYGMRAQNDLREKFAEETVSIESGTLTDDARTVSREDIFKAGERGRRYGADLFEKQLPKMVAATEKLVARLDDQITNAKEPITHAQMSSISKQLLVEPVFKWKGPRSMENDEQSAENWIRELMDMPPLEDEVQRKEINSHVFNHDADLDDAVVFANRWRTQVVNNYWKNMAGKMVNDNPYERAYISLRRTSDFASNAMTLDGRKAEKNPYWSSSVELLARSAASACYDRLADMGIENTYLTKSEPCRYSSSSYRADPDPQGVEREAFSNDFFECVVPYLKAQTEEAAEKHFAGVMPNEAAGQAVKKEDSVLTQDMA
jgi:hypothetical protein